MEFVDGCTLRNLLESGPLTTKKALHIAAQIGGGLAKAHAFSLHMAKTSASWKQTGQDSACAASCRGGLLVTMPCKNEKPDYQKIGKYRTPWRA